MSPDAESRLAGLLRRAMLSVQIADNRGATTSLDRYRSMVRQCRDAYEPALRIYVTLHDIQIQDDQVAEAVLVLVRDELNQFFGDDTDLTAPFQAANGMGEEPAIGIIITNLMRAAIVDGPGKAAKALYASINRGFLVFQNFHLLTGIRVETEVRVAEGISLVSLPNDVADLPWFLPATPGLQPEDFVSKTVLRVDVPADPSSYEPPSGYIFTSDHILAPGPEQRFQTRVRGGDGVEFYPQRFLQALTLVGEQPVREAIMWRHFADDHVFDMRRGVGFQVSSPSAFEITDPSPFSNEQIGQAWALYDKLSAWSRSNHDRLRVPIDRWTKSLTHRDPVDRMIDLGIAFESLFLPGIKNEVTFRFVLRGSLYLGEGIEERRRLKREFAEIYDCRSTAVHEGTLPNRVAVNGEDLHITQFVERSQGLFKRCLMKVINDGGLPDWTALEMGGPQEKDASPD